MIFADKNKAAKPQMEDYRNPCELIWKNLWPSPQDTLVQCGRVANMPKSRSETVPMSSSNTCHKLCISLVISCVWIYIYRQIYIYTYVYIMYMYIYIDIPTFVCEYFMSTSSSRRLLQGFSQIDRRHTWWECRSRWRPARRSGPPNRWRTPSSCTCRTSSGLSGNHGYLGVQTKGEKKTLVWKGLKRYKTMGF